MQQLIFTNRAINDIAKAKKWYNTQQPNLGLRFTDYIFKCAEEIHNNPLFYPNKYKATREYVVKKYPYVIIYSIEENYLFVLRVFPCKTSPKGKYIKNKG
jgi:toxin ParE1/3/4